MAEKTVLDFDLAENISKADVLYLLQGTGLDRDKYALLGAIFPDLYDYVVDSDEKLQALCDGTVTGAYSVYIAEGSWTATEGSSWDMDTTGTFVLHGHKASILNFSGAVDAITGTSTSSDFESKQFRDVHIVMDNGADTSGYIRGFVGCFDLDNCTVEITCTGGNPSLTAGGFFASLKLANCDVSISGECAVGAYYLYTGIAATAVLDENKYGVYGCNLTLDVSAAPTIEGFSFAHNLVNCHVSVLDSVSSSESFMFTNCDFLENCTIYVRNQITAAGTFFGFNGCNDLNNVKLDGAFFGSADAVQTIRAFVSCKRISNFYVNIQSTNGGCQGFSSCENISVGEITIRGISNFFNCFSSCKWISNVLCKSFSDDAAANDNRAFYDCENVSCSRIIMYRGVGVTGTVVAMYNCSYITNVVLEEGYPANGTTDGFENCDHMSVCSGVVTGTMNNGCGFFDTDTCFV